MKCQNVIIFSRRTLNCVAIGRQCVDHEFRKFERCYSNYDLNFSNLRSVTAVTSEMLLVVTHRTGNRVLVHFT